MPSSDYNDTQYLLHLHNKYSDLRSFRGRPSQAKFNQLSQLDGIDAYKQASHYNDKLDNREHPEVDRIYWNENNAPGKFATTRLNRRHFNKNITIG